MVNNKERAALVKIIAAWESLPGDTCYTPKQIGDWLHSHMKPAIDNARAAIKERANGR